MATNAFHRFRALRTFRCAAKAVPAAERPGFWGADVAPDMVYGNGPLLDGLLRQHAVLRECAAILYYWLRGWLC